MYRFPSERNPKEPKITPPNVAAILAFIATLVLGWHALEARTSLTLWSADGAVFHWEGSVGRHAQR